jgi:DNA invertase Pin-like site-specific DNA recombinase
MVVARAAGVVLLIAKLDRLSRNPSFILALRDSGVKLVCCDMLQVYTLTVGLIFVLAQHERGTSSMRNRNALAPQKARGSQLGPPANLTNSARKQSLLVRLAPI